MEVKRGAGEPWYVQEVFGGDAPTVRWTEELSLACRFPLRTPISRDRGLQAGGRHQGRRGQREAEAGGDGWNQLSKALA